MGECQIFLKVEYFLFNLIMLFYTTLNDALREHRFFPSLSELRKTCLPLCDGKRTNQNTSLM